MLIIGSYFLLKLNQKKVVLIYYIRYVTMLKLN